jgi:hypothetical protein
MTYSPSPLRALRIVSPVRSRTGGTCVQNVGSRMRCTTHDSFNGWASKLPNCWFCWVWASKLDGVLRSKIGGGTWRHRKGCVQAKQLRVEGKCWGEGKGATPRSKSSLITADQTGTEQAGTPFAWSAPDEDRRRSHPTVRPRPAQRPTGAPAHCNGPCVAAASYGPDL